MGHKRYTVQLGIDGLEYFKNLLQIELNLETKAEELRKRVAELIAEEAQKNFKGAIMPGEMGASPQVSVSVSEQGDTTLVIADGDDAVWVEFGTGVSFNGGVGTSPHPKGDSLGMTIGSYGQGKGRQETWGYYDGEALILTHGIPAQAPLYRAYMNVIQDLKKIANEVFFG